MRASLTSQWVLVLLLSLSWSLPAIEPVAAQTIDQPQPLQVYNTSAGFQLHWNAREQRADLLPTIRFQGYELPMQLYTVQLGGTPSPDIQIDQLVAEPWVGELAPAAPLAPPVADDSLVRSNATPELVALPTAPVFVLRSGQLYGQPIAVIAVSPIYQADNGQVYQATAFQATVAQAALIQPDNGEFLAAARTAAQPTIHAAADTQTLAPINPLARQHGYKILVEQPGLQQLSGQALIDAGISLATLNPATLDLLHNGTAVPLEIIGLVNGQLAATSAIRFYTATVGNRWNLNEIYWLTSNSAGGKRMSSRPVAPGSAATSSTVIERNVWVENRVYDSYQPGADGDHWFHRELRFNPSQPPPTATVRIDAGLPSVAGSAYYSLTMSTHYGGEYSFTVQAGATEHALTWQALPVNGHSANHTIVISSTTPVEQLTIRLTNTRSAFSDAAVWLDRAPWQQVATLDLAGSGGEFVGFNEHLRYGWQNAPTDQGAYRLYDVSNPAAPIVLTGATASGFEDVGGRSYLLAGPGTVHAPTIQPHRAAQLPAAAGAEAIYIAPDNFIAVLEPLLAHRRGQGYSVVAVDVQAIYDHWSYGQISAEAIRTFLRFARATWQQTPISVVMVGDGTWDPHNYERKAHFTNYVPPYVAYVDPWLGEAACDNCYAQLDGDDPLTGDNGGDENGRFFAIDIWIGRFPVKSVLELDMLVNKIIRYETDQTLGDWRNVNLFFADNYIQQHSEGSETVRDNAGDFARMSDLMIRRTLCAETALPGICDLSGENSDHAVTPARLREQIAQLKAASGLQVGRYYYDPFPAISDPDRVEGWRMENAAATKRHVIDALSRGAGLAIFSGHSNHWQWGRMDQDESVAGFVTLNDPDAFTNRDELFIALSMTCMTAQFHKPADSGTTLDERLFVTGNGAIAVWGSSGLSVVYGHDALQRGFLQTLYQTPAMTARLGELIEAGYIELLTHNVCCQDAAQTFLLLGDPLTPARVQPHANIRLPVVQK